MPLDSLAVLIRTLGTPRDLC